MLRAAVLTISDSCYSKQREDSSGPAVAETLGAHGWEVSAVRVLPDDAAQISQVLQAFSEDVSAVFTTGGTGLSPRDVTPEATRQVISREIPGLAEMMRSAGLKHTRRAALSRGIVGVRNKLLIVNLPGSPAGARQSLEAIADLLPHAVELIRGGVVRHD